MPHTIIMDIEGFEITSEEHPLILHPNVAGIILFTRNVSDRAQLCRLTQEIHTLRPDILIMTDHEGGEVQRFRRMGFTPLMSAGRHGRNYDKNPQFALEIAYDEGKQMAEDLLACGVDLSLAPVLDLYHSNSTIIGQLDRAFHADPDSVISLAKAYIQGMHEAHMPAIGKHFPGHGSCVKDSHLDLPRNDKDNATLRATDLKPFIELMRENILDGVMPAHVVYPSIDETYATTYSRTWLHDILREELKFDGLVMSDCLGMKGADIGGLIERAHKALEGCDILIAANQKRPILKELLDAIPLSHSNTRFEAFKQKTLRFQTNNNIRAKSSEILFSADQPIKPNTKIVDPLNPTAEV